MFICDLASNIFEIMLQSLLQLTGTSLDGFPVLAVIALARTGLASVIFMGEKHYRILLTKEEHENRYQRLFLMTTSLKNEVYFMKKNSEEIESVMSNAYPVSYTHLDVYKRQGVRPATPAGPSLRASPAR